MNNSNLTAAVKYLHESGIAHRDLKIENLMFSEAGGDIIKVGDFGLAKRLGKLPTKTPVGTKEYMVSSLPPSNLSTPLAFFFSFGSLSPCSFQRHLKLSRESTIPPPSTSGPLDALPSSSSMAPSPSTMRLIRGATDLWISLRKSNVGITFFFPTHWTRSFVENGGILTTFSFVFF